MMFPGGRRSATDRLRNNLRIKLPTSVNTAAPNPLNTYSLLLVRNSAIYLVVQPHLLVNAQGIFLLECGEVAQHPVEALAREQKPIPHESAGGDHLFSRKPLCDSSSHHLTHDREYLASVPSKVAM